MKKLLLLGLLVTTAYPGLAQTLGPASTALAPSFRGANVVIIHTSDSTASAYLKLARVLLSQGYAIDESDKKLGYLQTQYRPSNINKVIYLAVKATVQAESNGSKIELRGYGRVPSQPARLPA
jgi:hypothetical protein